MGKVEIGQAHAVRDIVGGAEIALRGAWTGLVVRPFGDARAWSLVSLAEGVVRALSDREIMFMASAVGAAYSTPPNELGVRQRPSLIRLCAPDGIQIGCLKVGMGLDQWVAFLEAPIELAGRAGAAGEMTEDLAITVQEVSRFEAQLVSSALSFALQRAGGSDADLPEPGRLSSAAAQGSGQTHAWGQHRGASAQAPHLAAFEKRAPRWPQAIRGRRIHDPDSFRFAFQSYCPSSPSVEFMLAWVDNQGRLVELTSPREVRVTDSKSLDAMVRLGGLSAAMADPPEAAAAALLLWVSCEERQRPRQEAPVELAQLIRLSSSLTGNAGTPVAGVYFGFKSPDTRWLRWRSLSEIDSRSQAGYRAHLRPTNSLPAVGQHVDLAMN